ncbi:MAG: hypothetical protein LAP87_07695 [Acidobacteriia bacterium]|nr:hypothetical protein [Terriglobia bacterium]
MGTTTLKSQEKSEDKASKKPRERASKLTAKKAPRPCRECSRWNEIKQRLRVTEVLEDSIEKVKKKLTSEEFKPTVADYLKLLQVEKDLEREFEDGSPKEIEVTWVEPLVTSDPSA